MVDSESRNNIIVVVVLVAIALLIVAFIYVFANSMLQVAQHGEDTLNIIGKSVTGNISETTKINKLNLEQFNRSMTDVINSNDRIVASNNKSLDDLSQIVNNFSKYNTKYLAGVQNNTSLNRQTFLQLLDEQKHTTAVLENISKQLDSQRLFGSTTTNITTPK